MASYPSRLVPFRHPIAHLDPAHPLFPRSNDAHETPMAEPFQSKLSSFQKMCFLRCIRPDKVGMAIQAFVTEHLGQRYIEPPPFDLGTCFKESAPVTPLIFVLSSGEWDMISSFN